MKLTLYTNNDDNRVVTKNITQLQELTGTLRANTSIIDPVIQVENFNNALAAKCNYAKIDEFGRYYYVNDIVFTGLLYEIHMHVDVVSSFQTELKKLEAVVSRQENLYNLYLQDGLFKTYQNPNIAIYPFSGAFTDYQYILCVAGA